MKTNNINEEKKTIEYGNESMERVKMFWNVAWNDETYMANNEGLMQ